MLKNVGDTPVPQEDAQGALKPSGMKKQIASSIKSVSTDISAFFKKEVPGVFKKGIVNLQEVAQAASDKISQKLDKLSTHPKITPIMYPTGEEAALEIDESTVNAHKVSIHADQQTSTKEIKFATSNLGKDAGLGDISKYDTSGGVEEYLKNNVAFFKTFVNEILVSDKGKLNEITTAFDNAGFSKEHKEYYLGFLKNINNLNNKLINNQRPIEKFIYNEKALINKLVSFLNDQDGRVLLMQAEVVKKNVNVEYGLQDITPPLSKINKAIYSFHNFNKLKKDFDANKGGNETFVEYKNKMLEQQVSARFNSINQQDFCFLQEFDEGERNKIDSKMQVFSSDVGTAIVINSKRFDPIEKSQIKIPEGSKTKINEDGSIGASTGYRVVIVKDKETGNKMLLCSVHLGGYAIGDRMATENAVREMKMTLKAVEELATANDVDGIIMGGDFNSVEESVNEQKSPLDLVAAREYVSIRSERDTSVSPPGFIQPLYSLSRRIDHLFYKMITKPNAQPPTVTPEARTPTEILHDPLEQHKGVYDHTLQPAALKMPLKPSFQAQQAQTADVNKPAPSAPVQQEATTAPKQTRLEAGQDNLNRLKIAFGVAAQDLEDLENQKNQKLTTEMYNALEDKIEKKAAELAALDRDCHAAEAEMRLARDEHRRADFLQKQKKIRTG
jgi:hypothetical protein